MKKIGIVFLIAMMGCSLVEADPMAVVEGKVTLSPLCGIVPAGQTSTIKGSNPCNLSDEALDSIYGNYTVLIKDNKNTVLSQRKLNRTGTFSFDVNDGNYVLTVESSAGDVVQFNSKESIEKSIVASKTQKQYIEFSINTGIR